MLKEKILWKAAEIFISRTLKYIDKKPAENLIKLINISEKFTKKIFTGQFLVSLVKLLGATLCSAAGMFVLYMILHADQNTCGLWRNLLTCCGVFLPGIGLYAVCLKLFGIKFYPSGKE